MIARSPSLIVPVTRSMADSVSDCFSVFVAGPRTPDRGRRHATRSVRRTARRGTTLGSSGGRGRTQLHARPAGLNAFALGVHPPDAGEPRARCSFSLISSTNWSSVRCRPVALRMYLKLCCTCP